jgi:hypothetical protein
MNLDMLRFIYSALLLLRNVILVPKSNMCIKNVYGFQQDVMQPVLSVTLHVLSIVRV